MANREDLLKLTKGELVKKLIETFPYDPVNGGNDIWFAHGKENAGMWWKQDPKDPTNKKIVSDLNHRLTKEDMVKILTDNKVLSQYEHLIDSDKTLKKTKLEAITKNTPSSKYEFPLETGTEKGWIINNKDKRDLDKLKESNIKGYNMAKNGVFVSSRSNNNKTPINNPVAQMSADRRKDLIDVFNASQKTTLSGRKAEIGKGAYSIGTSTNFNVKKTDNIAVFDFETLGSQKGEFWTPTQIAIESLNDDKKSYSKFVKMDTKSATAINNALNTIKNGKTQELKPEIVRSLLWLADIDVDKETGEIFAKHTDYGKNVSIFKDTELFAKIQRGYDILNEKNTDKYLKKGVSFQNLASQTQIKKDIEKNWGDYVFAGHNSTNFDSKMIEKMNIKIPKGFLDTLALARRAISVKDAPTGYGMEALIKNEKLKNVFQDFIKERADLEHTAKYDVKTEKAFLKYLFDNHSDMFTQANNKDSFVNIQKGQVSIAGKGMVRDTKEDFTHYDSTLNNKKGSYDAELLFSKNKAYEFGGIVKNNNGYSASFVNLETGKTTMLNGSLQRIMDVVGNIFNFDFGDVQDPNGNLTELGKEVKHQSINSIMSYYDNLEKQLQIYEKENNIKTKRAENITQTQKNRYKFTKDFIKENYEDLNYLSKTIKNSDLNASGKEFVMQTISKLYGMQKNSVMLSNDIETEILKETSMTKASYEKAYLNYIDAHKQELGSDYSAIKSAIKKLEVTDTDFGIDENNMKKNPFYHITQQIANSMVKKAGPKKINSIPQLKGDYKLDFKTQLGQIIDLTKQSFIESNENNSIASQLYQNFAGTDLAKVISGEHLQKRMQKINERISIANKNKDVMNLYSNNNTVNSEFERKTEKDFAEGTFGSYLNKLEKVAKDKGLSLYVKPNAKGTSLDIGFYNSADTQVFDTIFDSNGEFKLSPNKGHMATFNIPIPDSDGIYSKDGIDAINGLELRRSSRGTAYFTSLPEQIIQGITGMIEKGEAATFKKLERGEFTSAEKALRYMVRERLNSSQTGSMYTSNVSDEIRSQTKAGGTVDQMASRKEMTRFRDYLSSVYKANVKTSSDLMVEPLEKELQLMFNYLYLENQVEGLGDAMISSDTKGLEQFFSKNKYINTNNLNGIFEELRLVAGQLPKIHMEDVKEETFSAMRASFTGYQDRTAFGDLNASYMRALAQAYNYLNRSDSAKKAIKNYEKKQEELGRGKNVTRANFRSGHISKAEYEKAAKDTSKTFYNIKHLDDKELKETIGMLTGISNPSVYEGMAIINQEMANMLGVTNRRNLKLNEFDKNFGLSPDFLNSIGRTPEEIQNFLNQFINGDEIQLPKGKEIKLKEETLLAHSLEDELGEKHSINLPKGSIIHGFKKVDGKWTVDFTENIQSYTGTKGLTGEGDRITYQVVTDEEWKTLTDKFGSNINMFLDKRDVSSRYLTATVGSRYDYILSTALENGLSFSEVDKAIDAVGKNSVIRKYLTALTDEQRWATFAEQDRNGIWKDILGNDLFSGLTHEDRKNAVKSFITTPEVLEGEGLDSNYGEMSRLIDNLVMSFKLKNPNISKQKLLDFKKTLSSNITRTNILTANDPHYARINNFKDQGQVDSEGNVRIGNREIDSMANSISYAQLLDETIGLQKNGNIMDWNEFRERILNLPKTKNQEKLQKHQNIIQEAIDNTFKQNKIGGSNLENMLTVKLFKEGNSINKNEIFLEDFAKSLDLEKGTVTKEEWEQGTYASLMRYVKENGFKGVKIDSTGSHGKTGFSFKTSPYNDSNMILKSFYLPLIEDLTYVDGRVMPNKIESAFNTFTSTMLDKDKIQSGEWTGAAEKFLGEAFNFAFHKDGAMFKELNTTKVNVSAPSVLLGTNLSGFKDKIDTLENSVFYSPEKLKALIRPSNDVMKRNLGFLYNDLFKDEKDFKSINLEDLDLRTKDGQNKINKILNKIVTSLDVANFDPSKGNQLPKSLQAYFHRFPSISGKDMKNVHLRVDSRLAETDNTASYISPGLAALINGDYDGDKGYLYFPFLADKDIDQEKFSLMTENLRAMNRIDSSAAKIMARRVIEKMESEVGKNTADKTAEEMLSSSISQTINLLSKTNKEFTGYFSNVNYSYGQIIDKIRNKALVNEKLSASEKFKRIAGATLMRGFFQSFEQDSISAKKVANRMQELLESGNSIDFLTESQGLSGIFSILNNEDDITRFAEKGLFTNSANLGIFSYGEDGKTVNLDSGSMQAQLSYLPENIANLARLAENEGTLEEFEKMFNENGMFGFAKDIYEDLKANGFDIEAYKGKADALKNVSSEHLEKVFSMFQEDTKDLYGVKNMGVARKNFVKNNLGYGMTKVDNAHTLVEILNKSLGKTSKNQEEFLRNGEFSQQLEKELWSTVSEDVKLDTADGKHDYIDTKTGEILKSISATALSAKLLGNGKSNELFKTATQEFQDLFKSNWQKFSFSNNNKSFINIEQFNDDNKKTVQEQFNKITENLLYNSYTKENLSKVATINEENGLGFLKTGISAASRGTLNHFVIEKIEEKAKQLRNATNEKGEEFSNRVLSSIETDKDLSISTFTDNLKNYINTELINDQEFQKLYLELNAKNKAFGLNNISVESVLKAGKTYLDYEVNRFAELENKYGKGNVDFNVGQKIAEKSWKMSYGEQLMTGTIDLIEPVFDKQGNLLELKIADHKFKKQLLGEQGDRWHSGIPETLQLTLGSLAYKKLIKESPDKIASGMKKSFNQMSDEEKKAVENIQGIINQFKSDRVNMWQISPLSTSDLVDVMNIYNNMLSSDPNDLKAAQIEIAKALQSGNFNNLSLDKMISFDEHGKMVYKGARTLHNLQTIKYDKEGNTVLKNLDLTNATMEDVILSWMVKDGFLNKKEKTKKGKNKSNSFQKEKMAFFDKNGKLFGEIWEGLEDNINLNPIYDAMGGDDISQETKNQIKGWLHTHKTPSDGKLEFSQSDIQALIDSPFVNTLDYMAITDGEGHFKALNLKKIDEDINLEAGENRISILQRILNKMVSEQGIDVTADGKVLKDSKEFDKDVDINKYVEQEMPAFIRENLQDKMQSAKMSNVVGQSIADQLKTTLEKNSKAFSSESDRTLNKAQEINKTMSETIGTHLYKQDGSYYGWEELFMNWDNGVNATQKESIFRGLSNEIEQSSKNNSSLDPAIDKWSQFIKGANEVLNYFSGETDLTDSIQNKFNSIVGANIDINDENAKEAYLTALGNKEGFYEIVQEKIGKENQIENLQNNNSVLREANQIKQQRNEVNALNNELNNSLIRANLAEKDAYEIRKKMKQGTPLTEKEREKVEKADQAIKEAYNLHNSEGKSNPLGSLKDFTKSLDRQFENQDKETKEEQAKATKTAISDLQTLQQMLSQNAPNQFTKSITNDLGQMLSKLDESEQSFESLVGKLSTEQKVQIQQGILNNVDQSLGTISSAEQGMMQLEPMVGKGSVIQQKQVQMRMNQLNLQKAGAQADIDRQLMMTEGTDLHKQIQDRQDLSNKMNEQIKLYNKENGAIDKNMAKMTQFGQSVKGMLHTSFQYGVIYRGAQSVIQQIYTIIGSIQEFDALMTQLRMINGAGEDITANMIAGYKKLGDEMGLTTQEVTATAVTFLRQGRSIADTNELMRQSAILAKTAFMDQNQAAELLTSTLNGFKLEAKDAAKVIDLVAYTDTMTATSANELMTAFQYVASSADTAGIEVEKLNAMIATSSEATRLSAQMIGTAYKTIVSRLQQVKVGSLVDAETGEDISNVDKMLKQYGLTVMDVNGKMKDGDQILSEFAELWNSWGNDTAKKREAVEALAGTRQGNIAMSLFENWDRYEEILAETEENAAGSASKKMDVAKESIQTSLAQLQNALRQFGDSEWAGDLFKWVVDLGTGFVNIAPKILVAVAAFRLLKTQGSDLTTMYQMQTNMVNKLRMGYLGLKDALMGTNKASTLQAQQMLNNSQLKTTTVGDRTAFYDPKTGQIAEQMDNTSAAQRMGLYNEDNFRRAMELKNKNVEGYKYAETNSGKYQSTMYHAAFQGKMGSNVNEATEIVDNYRKSIDQARFNEHINPQQRELFNKYGSYLANSGIEGADKALQKGALILGSSDTNAGERIQAYMNEVDSYMQGKQAPDTPLSSEEQLQVEVVKAFNKELTEATSSLKIFADSLKKQAGIKDGVDETKQTTDNPDTKSESNTKGKASTTKTESGVTTTETPTKIDGTGAGNNLPGMGDTVLPSTPKGLQGWKAKMSAWNAKYADNKKVQAASGLGGMVGMIGGMQGFTSLADSLGANSSASSMIGFVGGMGTQMLSTFGPAGAIASGILGMAGGLFSAIKEHKEKEHQEVMNTIKEAKDAFNSLQSNLRDIQDDDFQNEFKRLSQGVDENGQNVSLSDEEYESYQSAVEKLTDGHEELIKGYTEEGNAIIDRNTLMEESIRLTKEQMEAEKQKMYSEEALKETGEDLYKKQGEYWEDYKKTNQYKDSKYTDQSTFFGKFYADYLSPAKVKGFVENGEFTAKYADEKEISKIIEQLKEDTNYTEGQKEQIVEYLKEHSSSYAKERLTYEKNITSLGNQYKTNYKGYVDAQIASNRNWSDDKTGMMGDIINGFSYDQVKNLKNEKFGEGTYALIDEYADLLDNSEIYGLITEYKDLEENGGTIEAISNKRYQLLNALETSGNLTGNTRDMLVNLGILGKPTNADGSERRNGFNYNFKGSKFYGDGTVYAEGYEDWSEAKALNIDPVMAELIDKIEKDSGKEIGEAFEGKLNKLTKQEIEDLNNNFSIINWDSVIDGSYDLSKAIKELDGAAKDFTDDLNIASLKKYSDGISSLFDITKSFKENSDVLSPEMFENLTQLKETFQLSEGQINQALGVRNEAGEITGWTLDKNAVTRLIGEIVTSTIHNNDLNEKEIQVLQTDLKEKGITGTDNVVYGAALNKLIKEGYLIADETNGLVENTAQKMSDEQAEVYKNAIKTDFYQQNKDTYKRYAQAHNEDTFIQNLGGFFNMDSEGAEGNLEKFSEGLQLAIKSLGGFESALAKIDGSKLVSDTTALKLLASSDPSQFATYWKQQTGETFGNMTDDEITVLGKQAVIAEKEALQLKRDEIANMEVADNAIVGMTEEELRDTRRSIEDLEQKIVDLKKEARLSKLKLDIDLVQVGIDKLNKSVSTLSSSMDLLSEKDGIGRFDLLTQQLSTVNKLSGDLNAEWSRLEEALSTAETGEEQQAIVEQMSAISDSMTDSAMKQIQLEKEMNDVLANGFADRISNMKSIVDRELNMLDVQKKKTDSKQFIYYNPNAIGLFGSINRDKTEYEKKRSETQKIIEEEKKRQEEIAEIRKQSLEEIYEDEAEKRTRELKRAEEDLAESTKKIADNTKESVLATYDSMLAELQTKIDNFNATKPTMEISILYKDSFSQGSRDFFAEEQAKGATTPSNWGLFNQSSDEVLKDWKGEKNVFTYDNIRTNLGKTYYGEDFKLGSNQLNEESYYIEQLDKIFGEGTSALLTVSGGAFGKNTTLKDNKYTTGEQGALVFKTKNYTISQGGAFKTNSELENKTVFTSNGAYLGVVKADEEGNLKIYKTINDTEGTTIPDKSSLVFISSNDIGTPYGNKLATSIINNTNSRISKIAGEKADEWLFHGDGSIERLDYKQGGTVIPSDTEVAGSRYTDQLDDVLLRDKGTSGGNKIANLFDNKNNFTKIFEESLNDISTEVSNTTSAQNSGDDKNIFGIIKKANESISEEEKVNKETIQKNTKDININIAEEEKETKNKIYNQNSIMNDEIIKNTEEFSTKFNTAWKDIMDNVLSYMNTSSEAGRNMVEEAKKYIGQNNADGKFSKGIIDEWCAYFVSSMADRIGLSTDMLPRSGGVSSFYNFFKDNNALTTTPTLGNLAMKGKSKHIGIVASVDGDKIVLIEGNTGNKDDRKSVVSQNTYSLNEMLKNGWEFGVYDKGIGSTNNKDLSHYGIMSEKKGEYKVDKKTGEWIYEPYETVVDTNKYDVISSEESQKIRSRQYDEGTVELENTDEMTPFQKELLEILRKNEENSFKFVSDEFAEYFSEYNRKYGEFVYQTAQRARDNNVDFYDYSHLITRYNKEQSDAINIKKIEETSKAMAAINNELGQLSTKLAEGKANGEDVSEIMESLNETYDNYQDTLEQLNEQLNDIAETIKEELLADLTKGLSHTTSAIVRLKEELNELQHAANMMFDTQYQSKILNGMSSIVRLSEQLVATTNKADRLKGANANYTTAIQEAFETMMPGFWSQKNVGEALEKVFNADGSINEYAQDRFISTLKSLFDVNMGADQIAKIESTTDQNEKAKLIEELAIVNGISTEQMTAFINAQANFNAMVENSQSIYETAQEINSLEEQRFTQLNELISLQKEALNTEKEERFSLLKAINNNNQLLSEMVSLQSKLIRDVNVTDRASNMREQYNKTIDLAESQEEYVDTLRAELKNLINEFKPLDETMLDEYGETYINAINPRDWMDASGEIIAEYFNRDLNMLQEASKNAMEDGNYEQAAIYEEAIASMELIAQMQGEYTAGMKELGNILADGIAQQEEVIKQQSEWMKQYITELVSGLQYNINNNETLQSYISTATDSYGKFDRDNKQLSNNAEIGILQLNSDSLLKKLSTLKEETSRIKEDIYDITKVDLGTLFSADGERHAYNYTKFTRELEENLRNGSITNNEYTEILAKLETYEEKVKEEVQTQDDIIKNYQEINSAIEDQIKLAIEGYDWQIKKQETLLSLKEKQFETENKIYQLRLDLDKELRSAKQSTQWLTESERRKIFNEESYTRLYQSLDEMESKTTAYAEEYYDQIMGLTEDTLYQQEYITNEYERRLALVEMEYNITKQRVDLEKKQMELANVLAEKNSRVYVNGEWKQVANIEDVKNASEEVADIEAELKLAEEERLQKIQTNQMQEFIDSLKKNQTALENTMNYTSDTNQQLIDKLSEFVGSIVGEDLNGESLNQTVRNTVDSIANFNQSLDVLVDDTIKSAIDTLGTLKTSLEEKISNYTDEIDNLENQTERQNKRLEEANKDLFDSNSELCGYLDKLAEKIKETIEEIDTVNIENNYNSTPSDVHEAVNEIAWLKGVSEKSEKWLISNEEKYIKDISKLQSEIVQWTADKEVSSDEDDIKLDKLIENNRAQIKEKWTTLNSHYNTINDADYVSDNYKDFLTNNGYEEIVELANAYGYETFTNEFYKKHFRKQESIGKTVEEIIDSWVDKNVTVNKEHQKAVEKHNSNMLQIRDIYKIDTEDLYKKGNEQLEQKQEQLEQEASTVETEKNNAVTDTNNTGRQTENTVQQTINTLSDLQSSENIAESADEMGIVATEQGIHIKDLGVHIDNQGKITDEFGKEIGNLEEELTGFVSGLDDVLKKYSDEIKSLKASNDNKNDSTPSNSGVKYSGTYDTTAILPDGTKQNVTIKDGKTQTQGLPVGTIINTTGGDYKVTGVNKDGSYTSEKINKSSNSSGSTGNKNSATVLKNYSDTIKNLKESSEKTNQIGPNQPSDSSSSSSMPSWLKVDTNSKAYQALQKANGDRFTTEPIYNVDEIGKELILPPITSGRYAAMEYGSQIVPHNLSENILKWGSINPASINANKPDFTSNLTNNTTTYSIGTIKLDNVTNGENFIPELNRFLQRTITLNNR